MQQKTIIALAALAVVALASYLTLRAPDKGERIGPRPRPVPAFKATAVKELELTSNGGKDAVKLKHDNNSWMITAPGQWRADQNLVKTAVEQLEKLGFGDVVTQTP